MLERPAAAAQNLAEARGLGRVELREHLPFDLVGRAVAARERLHAGLRDLGADDAPVPGLSAALT